MSSPVIDELEAFRLAAATAAARKWPWRPPYWLDLDNGEWSVRSEGEFEVRVDAESGNVRPANADVASFEPTQALMIARKPLCRTATGGIPAFR